MRRGRLIRGRRVAPALLATCVAVAPSRRAAATHKDFIDETVVSQPFAAPEMGLEIGAESRLDVDYRVQGWYSPELEFAPHRRWFVEGVVRGVDRGAGLELGGWGLGTRLRIADERRAWIDVTAVVEYEVETAAAKHPETERLLVSCAALTRHVGSFNLTANLGAEQRLSPSPDTGFAWGFGARYPDGAVVAAGLELTREPLDRSTRIGPQAWIRLPGEARLRLGGLFDVDPLRYRFAARAILETEFF